jgi:phosphoglucomutase
MLVNVPRLITAYYTEVPYPSVPAQRVAFGTSGHRGSALDKAFNEWYILATSQAICLHRKQHEIDGPLFLGMEYEPNRRFVVGSWIIHQSPRDM